MPMVAGSLIVPTFGRNISVVIGSLAGVPGSFRAWSLGPNPAQTTPANVDADVTFTLFVLAFVAAPAGKPPLGSKVQIQASPLALFGGLPIAVAPITQASATGILVFYVNIPTFPGPIYGIVVTPDGSMVLAQQDELTLLR